MIQYFSVCDCTKHCGMPVRIACIVLNCIAAVLYGFVLFFLPTGAAIVFMIIQGVIALGGLAASVTNITGLTTAYSVFQTLIGIPVWVVFGFVLNAIISHEPRWYFPDSYRYWLAERSIGLLWFVLIVAIVGTVVSSLALQGFRKLRLFQTGVHTVAEVARAPRTVVIQHPSTVAYTVPQATGPVYPTAYNTQPLQPMNQPTFNQPAYPLMTEQPPKYQP